MASDRKYEVAPAALPAYAVVALWFAQGAVQYLGAKTMASILGEPDIRDVAKWISQAVEELKQFIAVELRRALEEQYLSEVTDQIGGVQRNLIDYDLVRDKSLLKNSYLTLNTLLETTKRYELTTIILFANLVSLRLLSLAALVKDHREGGYRKVVKPTIAEGREHVQSTIALHVKWLEDGIGSVSPVAYRKVKPKKFPDYWEGKYSFRGGEHTDSNEVEAVVRERIEKHRLQTIARFEAEKTEAVKNVHDPLRASMQKWEELGDKLKSILLAAGEDVQ